MAKTLIIAEKPSVGGDIARVLGSRKRTKGYIDGDAYIVTWAIGHLISLCSPEELDESLKDWKFETLPIIPDQMKLKILPRTRQQFETIKYLIHREDVDNIICATDSGREGELIFRYIYHVAGSDKPFRRLWISSMTDEAIRDGFDHLKPGSEYDNLYRSAKCRAEADWLVGMNASRGYTLQYSRLLSVGRVQSPTLAILVKREHEIKNFVPEQYEELWASFTGYKGRWFDETKPADDSLRSRIPAEKHDWAAQFAQELAGKPAVVESLRRENKTIRPPALYDLTQLQRDANRMFGYTASKTLSLAQALYEKHKLITYPRTDSRYLSADIFKTLKTRLSKLDMEPWSTFVPTAMESQRKLFGPVINDARVSDHHAIIPTGRDPSRAKLDEDERALFDLIVRRFLVVFFDDEILEYVDVITRCDGQPFHSRGKAVQQAGWSAIYEGIGKKSRRKAVGEEDLVNLPALEEGMERKARSAKLEEKKTTPPPRYTEAMLLAAMENAGRLVDDEELREQMKDGGLGTPATRAAIIERLIQVQYVRRSGRQLVPTEKGICFVAVLPPQLSSPELTGRWEKGLAEIGRGELAADAFMDDIKKLVVDIVNASRQRVTDVEFPEDPRYNHDPDAPKPEKVSLGKCPACGGEIYENRKAYYCSNWRNPAGRCKFSIWKNGLERQGGPMLTPEMMTTLLTQPSLDDPSGAISVDKTSPFIHWAGQAEPAQPPAKATRAAKAAKTTKTAKATKTTKTAKAAKTTKTTKAAKTAQEGKERG
ncbi:MAG: DNA topoisomerase 3 [Eubacteriales bacterium]|nr:DNA topoisomerase 3 [Eubacteriales bacterium]